MEDKAIPSDQRSKEGPGSTLRRTTSITTRRAHLDSLIQVFSSRPQAYGTDPLGGRATFSLFHRNRSTIQDSVLPLKDNEQCPKPADSSGLIHSSHARNSSSVYLSAGPSQDVHRAGESSPVSATPARTTPRLSAFAGSQRAYTTTSSTVPSKISPIGKEAGVVHASLQRASSSSSGDPFSRGKRGQTFRRTISAPSFSSTSSTSRIDKKARGIHDALLMHPIRRSLSEISRVESPAVPRNSSESTAAINLFQPTTGHDLMQGDTPIQVPLTTGVLDIPITEWGVFAGITASRQYIPRKYVLQTRLIFNKYFERLFANTQDLIAWKKVLLIPIILFTKHKLEDFHIAMTQLQEDSWEAFSLDSLESKVTANHRSSIGVSTIHRKAHALVREGELSKAMKVLINPAVPADPSLHTLQMLQSKHPGRDLTFVNDEELDSLQHDDANLQHFIPSLHQIRLIIKKAHNGIQSGHLKLRFEHLKQLIGDGSEPQVGEELKFCNFITDLISCLLNNGIPVDILPAFQDFQLIALKKNENDVRPIGLGDLYRKIASKLIFQVTQEDFNKKHFFFLRSCRQFIYKSNIFYVNHSAHCLSNFRYVHL